MVIPNLAHVSRGDVTAPVSDTSLLFSTFFHFFMDFLGPLRVPVPACFPTPFHTFCGI